MITFLMQANIFGISFKSILEHIITNKDLKNNLSSIAEYNDFIISKYKETTKNTEIDNEKMKEYFSSLKKTISKRYRINSYILERQSYFEFKLGLRNSNLNDK